MKKSIACVLSLVMALSALFTGCTGAVSTKVDEEEIKTESKTEVKTTEKVENSDGREMIGNMYVEGLPIVKEKEKFTIFVDDSGKAEDKIMYPILEEQTNVEVELLLYPYEIAKEKKNILINSGKYPDVFGGWILGEKDILRDGMQEGLYVPIDEYIEKYAPKMQEVLSIPGVRQTMTLPDGHIYTVPYVIGTPKVDFMPYINREWLKAVGMEMPKTTEEFREVLRAFKTQDPNKNGKADEIPYSSDPNNKNLGYLGAWFGVSAGQKSPMGFAMVDGKLEYQFNKEGYKELMKYLASLYTEGLIDPELFTQDLSQWKAKGKLNLYGCSMAYGSGDFVESDIETGKTDFDPLPVLSSEYCDKPVYSRASYGAYTFRTQVAITDRAKHPEMIIRWFNNVFELDNSMQIQAGLFGKRLEKLGDRDYRFLDETKLSEADREKYGWGNMYTQSLPKYCPVDVKVKPVEGKTPKYEEKEAADAVYEPFLNESIPMAWASPDEAKKLSILETDINKYVEKKQAEWISGQADVEAEWDEYVKQLDKLGLQELLKIRSDAIEKMK